MKNGQSFLKSNLIQSKDKKKKISQGFYNQHNLAKCLDCLGSLILFGTCLSLNGIAIFYTHTHTHTHTHKHTHKYTHTHTHTLSQICTNSYASSYCDRRPPSPRPQFIIFFTFAKNTNNGQRGGIPISFSKQIFFEALKCFQTL